MLSESCETVRLSSGFSVSFENFKLIRPGKVELNAEIDFLNEMVYIRLNSCTMNQLLNLQIAYPGRDTISSVSKLVIGDDSLDSSNQLMAKRLSQKFRMPVILSFNYQIDEFQDQIERQEIFKWLVSILESRINTFK